MDSGGHLRRRGTQGQAHIVAHALPFGRQAGQALFGVEPAGRLDRSGQLVHLDHGTALEQGL